MTKELQEFTFAASPVVNEETRTVTGIAVPWNETALNIFGETTQFAKGAFAGADLPQVFYQHENHSTPIGRVESYKETDEGLEVSVRLATTPKADEIYSLLKEGFLDSFSVGIIPQESRDEDGITLHTKVDFRELSIVNRPAFSGAKVLEVHSDNADTQIQKKEVENEVEFNELNEKIEVLEREFSVMKNENITKATPSDLGIHSFGEFAQRIAKGDKDATELYAEYTGGTSDDTVVRNTFVGEFVNIINNGRPVWNVFSKGAWTNEGRTIEYIVLDSNTLAVNSQIAEGDDLAKGKISFTTKNAHKKTYGGWSELSIQEVQSANVNVVNRVYEGLGSRYAAVTELVVVNKVLSVPATDTLPVTADDWIDAVAIEGLVMKSQKGYAPDALIVSADVFGSLAKLTVSGEYLLDRQSGSLNLGKYTGSVFNVPVVISNTGTNFAAIASKEAIRTFESPGYRLQDTNVVNLTGAFSFYGEIAVAEQDLGLIKRFGS